MIMDLGVEWLAALWLVGALLALWTSSSTGVSTAGNVDIAGATSLDSTLRIDQNGALVIMNSTGAGANAGLWYTQVLNPGWRFGAANDDLSGQTDAITLTRAGNNPLGVFLNRAFGLPSAIGPFSLGGGVTHNYNPSGLSSAFLIRIQANGALGTLTGLAAQTPGTILAITMIDDTGSDDAIAFAKESASSSAANRFNFAAQLNPFGTIVLFYDGSISRWICLAEFASTPG